MAKVSGPLMSMDARGAYGGTLVFSGWKGRNTVRKLVTPSNPKSANQEIARNRVRVGGAMQHFANLAVTHGGGRAVTDKAALMTKAPAGYAWNGNLVDALIGSGGVSYTAATTAYNALTAPNKTTWDTAANALVPPMPAVAQKAAGGAAATALTSGNVFFLYTYALYLLGIATVPVAATPPTYA